MDDLISRQAAFEVLSDYYHHRTKIQHEALREALDRVPSAQSNGMWVEAKPFIGKHCSACGYEAYWDSDYGQQLFDYCPYCGADMRERGEDE